MEIKLTQEDKKDIVEGLFNKIKPLLNSSDETFTVKEVALKLKKHPNTVLNYIDNKALKATQKGKNYIITKQALDEFLER